MSELDGILVGAIDLHRHGYPEISSQARTGDDDSVDIRLCRDAGMTAVVMKSHTWPTTGRAILLEELVPGMRVVSSVTLNPISGGMRPEVVELAARQGAGVVYLPTAGARNDIERGGISRTIGAAIEHYHPTDHPGVTIVDENGALSSATHDVLDVVDQFGLMVYSGHVAPEEVLSLARDGRLADRFVFSHPDSHSIGATDDVIAEVARLGGFIEICALGLYPQIGRITPDDLGRIIRLVGAERCVMTTDYFFDWCPPSSVMLADLAAQLVGVGVTRAELDLMMRINPAHLLANSIAPVTSGHAERTQR